MNGLSVRGVGHKEAGKLISESSDAVTILVHTVKPAPTPDGKKYQCVCMCTCTCVCMYVYVCVRVCVCVCVYTPSACGQRNELICLSKRMTAEQWK